MPDTERTRAAILALLADNTTGDISPQDMRDTVVSLYAIDRAMTISDFDTETTSGSANPNGRGAVAFSDSLYTAVWTGSAWQYYNGSARVTRPPTSSWSWTNQNSATVSTSRGVLDFTFAQINGTGGTVYSRSAPATPWVLTARFVVVAGGPTGFYNCGICARESSTGKLIAIGPCNAPAIRHQIWSDINTLGGNTDYLCYTPTLNTFDLRIEDNGTNLITYVGHEGRFLQFVSAGRTATMTTGPDEIGWFHHKNNAGLTNDLVTIISWDVA
jgi:hypothetical protein